MPDVNPRGSDAGPTGPAAQVRPAPAPEVGYDRVFGLLSYELVFDLHDNFKRVLAAYAAATETNEALELRKKLRREDAYRSRMQSYYEKLSTPSAMIVLRALVINSPILTTAERLVLGVQKHYIEQYGLPMTRASLAKLLREREIERKRKVNTPPQFPPVVPTEASLAVEIGRIFDAGKIYDLIDRCPVENGTERPVVATAALVGLIKDAAAPSAAQLRALFEQIAASPIAPNNKTK